MSSPAFRVDPGGSLRGSVRVPGDKSISHRAVMLASLAHGRSEISGFLEGEDALATVAAMRALGAAVEGPEDGRLSVTGVGAGGLQSPATDLDMGNSGTSMRLLAGLLCGQGVGARLIGDESLSRRPMGRITEPLAAMGASITTGPGDRPPLLLRPGGRLRGIHYDMPLASAQVKSCLLLAGLGAQGTTSVREPAPTRDHTERMLAGFGYPVRREGDRVSVDGGGRLHGMSIDVPSDISSAAFLLVAGSIAPGSELLLEHVGVNPTRTGILEILRLMGADIEVRAPREIGGEPVADLRVRHAPLRGIRIPRELVPLAIDEFPVLFVAAACAEGRTELRGAEELRVKESDRIATMAEGLTALGVAVEVFEDGIAIEGSPYGGATIQSHHDHRIAMSFAVAGLRASAPIRIEHVAPVATSFPGFAELLAELGLRIRVDHGA